MKWIKLGFYGMILGLVFGSFVFILTMQIPFSIALFLHRASVSSFGIIASVFIIELLAVASSVWVCVEMRKNFSTFLQSKLNLQEDLIAKFINDSSVNICAILTTECRWLMALNSSKK